jgi:hypothetical protein
MIHRLNDPSRHKTEVSKTPFLSLTLKPTLILLNAPGRWKTAFLVA